MKDSPLMKFSEVHPSGSLQDGEQFIVAWQSPSNIAFVKYWGKKKGQLPITPSLSMTLRQSFTRTSVEASLGGHKRGLLAVNGDPGHPFLLKLNKLYEWLAEEIPVLGLLSMSVTTNNSFPHSTGIASSASGLSAFTLCLLDLAGKIINMADSANELLHAASYASRMGSGSACRSLYGGYTVWGETKLQPGASDEYAVPVETPVHPAMLALKDAILVISSEPKSLPSTMGHKAMDHHPFLNGRIGQVDQNLAEVLSALEENDFDKLATVAELEALTLHALIMSASPGTLLMKPSTVTAIEMVRNAREKGLPVFFTLDAGANVHVLYPAAESAAVEMFIRDELKPLCENNRVIYDGCGGGPVKLDSAQILP
jgi:diphosphomevalonate decarboxylase